MSLWVTPEGIDYLTNLVDHIGVSRQTRKISREEDILCILEARGGGYSKDQIIGFLEARPISEPLWGMTRKSYERTLEDLVRRGYVAEL